MSSITQRHLQKMDVVYYRKGISGCSDIGTLSVPGLTHMYPLSVFDLWMADKLNIRFFPYCSPLALEIVL